MGKSATTATARQRNEARQGDNARRREERATAEHSTAVSDNAVFAALGAMAAVIEEAHCFLGSDELRKLVFSHGRLSDAVGFKRDYRYADGQVLDCDGTVIKDARHV